MKLPSKELEQAVNALVEGFPANASQVVDEARPLFEALRDGGDRQSLQRCLVVELNARVYLGQLEAAEALMDRWEPVAEAEGWNLARTKFCNLRGIIARKKHDYVSAGTFYRRGLALAETAEDRGAFCGNLGNIFSQLGDFASAFDLLKQSLEHFREAGLERKQGEILLFMGSACQGMEQHELALRYFQQSFDLLDDTHDLSRKIWGWLCVSQCHGELSDIPRQREAIEQAEAMLKAAPDRQTVPPEDVMNVRSVWAQFELDHGDAQEGRRMLLDLLSAEQVLTAEKTSVLSLALANHAKTPPDLAEQMAQRAKAEAEERGYQKELAGAYRCLYRLAKERSPAEALSHLEKVLELEQVRFTETTNKRLQAVELQQKTWELGQELWEEQRLRKETARLLAEVEKQKARAEEANRAKTAILGLTAHDLRNQVASLLLGVETLVHATKKPDKLPPLPELARMITASGADLRDLLHGLLDYAAIQEGTLGSRPELVDLAELVTSAVAPWEKAAAEKEQTLALRLPPTRSIPGQFDPARLKQVLQNLVSNAVKYAPRNTEIEVALSKREDIARLDVRDRGPGIDADDEARLFQAFHPLSNRPTGDESSIGLGLHIAKAIIENEGGRIGYTPRDGGGSVFWVELSLDK